MLDVHDLRSMVPPEIHDAMITSTNYMVRVVHSVIFGHSQSLFSSSIVLYLCRPPRSHLRPSRAPFTYDRLVSRRSLLEYLLSHSALE